MNKQVLAECPMCGQEIAPKKLDELTARIAAEKDKEYSARYTTDLQKAVESATEQALAKATAAEKELQKYRSTEKDLLKREQALAFRNQEIDLEIQRRVAETQQQIITEASKNTETTYKHKLEEKDKVIATFQVKLREVETQEAELKKYRDRENDLREREESLMQKEQNVQKEIERRVEETYIQKYAADLQKAVETANQQALAKASAAEKELQKYREAEKDLLKREQALTFRSQEIDLEIQRKIAATQDQLIAQATERLEAKYAYKLQEKDKAITDMQAKLQEAQAKAEAAGAQSRGDLQEADILGRLKTLYPTDEIEQIARSRGGADLLHIVKNHEHKPVGTILWESKNTQKWSEGWLTKLREDQRKANADIAILVSVALPEDQPQGGFREGVLVLRPDTVEEVAPILRQSLINIQQQKAAGQLQDEKAQRILEYLGGKEFNLLLTGIVEDISAFRELDEKEERLVLRAVAKRRELRQRTTRRLARMFGTLQGIMGSLPEVPGLQLLEPPASPESLTNKVGTDIDSESN